jgi:secreted trypsin-like serine protease
VNGTEVHENDAIIASIVSVYDLKNGGLCTGSLIAPGIVLTAAHCITSKASDLRVIFGTNVDEWLNAREPDVKAEHVRSVSQTKVHPDWNFEKNQEKETDWNDIALVKFKGDIPEGFKPATILQDSSVLVRGTEVTFAGYGVSLVETPEVDPKKVKNLEEAIENGDVYCDEPRKICFMADYSGEGLLRMAKAPISSVQETEVRLNEKLAGTCGGDSGGPAYIEKDGVYYLFGITSRGSPLCNSTGVYTNALSFASWLNPIIKEWQAADVSK